MQILELRESFLQLFFNLALRLRGRELFLRAIAFLPQLSLLKLLVVDLLQNVQILEEVLLVAIHRKYFEDRDHLIVPFRHHIMEEGGVVVPDLTLKGVLPEYFVLELYDLCEILLVIGSCIPLTSRFIRVIIDFQIFISMWGMLILG